MTGSSFHHSGVGRPVLDELVGEMLDAGLRRVHVLAWRDLDDPDAGGSEVHADEFMRRWQRAGLEVVHRTSAARGVPAESTRNGYRVVRRGGRMSVFARVPVAEILGRMGRRDGLVEIWNGVPWFSPVWCRSPRVLVLHHVHGPMWDQMFPRPLAALGRSLESRVAPPFYRRTPTVTTSEDTRRELLELGWCPELVRTGPVGVDPWFSPSTDQEHRWFDDKTTEPSVLVVGRQAPVKRMHVLLEQAELARASLPALRVTLVGDGPERASLETWVADHDARSWVSFAGRVSREELRDHYRRAWVVASASLAEGWGLALTEAAGCGTPAVATDIGGHRCSVVDGVTGLLAPSEHLHEALVRVLGDRDLRRRLSAQAQSRARNLSWDDLAVEVLRPLHAQRASRPTGTNGH